MAIVVTLIWLFAPSQSARPQALAAAIVFTLVTVTSWVLLQRARVGDPFGPIDTAAFVRNGGFTSHSLTYQGHPAAPTLASFVALTASLPIYSTLLVLLTAESLVFPLLIYLLLDTWDANHHPKAMLLFCGIVLTLFSSRSLYSTFSGYSAGNLGILIMLPNCLLLLVMVRRRKDVRTRLLMLIGLTAITITHFNAMIVVLLIITGLLTWLPFRKPILGLSTVMLFWIAVLTWDTLTPYNGMLYAATSFSREAIQHLFYYKLGIVGYWLGVTQSGTYTSASQPLWARIVWQSWPLMAVCLSSAVIAGKLRHVRRWKDIDRWELTCFVAIALLAVVLVVFLSFEDLYNRGLVALAVVMTPAVVRWLDMRWHGMFATVGRCVIVVMLAAVPASVLAYNGYVNIAMQHESEVSGGRFLSAATSGGRDVRVYGLEASSRHLDYYLPFAVFRRRYYGSYRTTSVEDLWTAFEQDETEFLRAADPGVAVIELSPRWEEPFRRYVGGDPKKDVRWQQLWTRLGGADRVYDNGEVTFYVRSE